MLSEKELTGVSFTLDGWKKGIFNPFTILKINRSIIRGERHLHNRLLFAGRI